DAVRMVEPAHRAGLVLESRKEIGALGERRMEELDRHDAAEPDALAPIHDAHRAAGDALDHAISAREHLSDAGVVLRAARHPRMLARAGTTVGVVRSTPH